MTPEEDRATQRQFRDLAREVSRLKKAALVAREKQLVAEARSHEMKLRAKSAELSLRGLQQDALRYRYLRTLDDWIQFQGYLECEPEGLNAHIDKMMLARRRRRRADTVSDMARHE